MLSVISTVKCKWEDADFTSLQRLLEQTVVEIAAKKEKSDSGRSQLITLIEKFRQESPEIRKAVVPLIKSFQTEIDSSNTRSTFAEDAYLQVFNKLIDLPDPIVALNEAFKLKDNLESSDAELNDLRRVHSELKQKDGSFKKLERENKRLQLTINQLKQQCDDNMFVLNEQKKVNGQFEAKENEFMIFKEECDNKLVKAEQKCLALSNALNEARSELFEVKTNLEKTKTSKSNELDLLTAELNKANEKLQFLESVGSNGSESSVEVIDHQVESRELQNRIDELNMQLLEKHNENRTLTCQLSDLKTATKNEQTALSAELEKANLANSELDRQLTLCQEELKVIQEALGEARQELDLVKSIEFGSSSPADEAGAAESRQLPLEHHLARQCRQLQTHSLTLESENGRLRAQLDQLTTASQEADLRDCEQTRLIQSLESNLHQMHLAYNEVDAKLKQQPMSTVSVEGNLLAQAITDNQQTQSGQPAIVESKGSDHSLLQIVQNQRDRFHARTCELEHSESTLRQQLASLETEVSSVRKDNVKLYEKLRFLQSYRPESSSNDDQVTGKYSAHYEAGLNPFQRFARSEQGRSYRRLPLHEKALYQLTRLMTDSRRTRLIAFIYVLLLHFFVFLALYYGAYFQISAYEAENNCLSRYAEHMQSAHGLARAPTSVRTTVPS